MVVSLPCLPSLRLEQHFAIPCYLPSHPDTFEPHYPSPYAGGWLGPQTINQSPVVRRKIVSPLPILFPLLFTRGTLPNQTSPLKGPPRPVPHSTWPTVLYLYWQWEGNPKQWIPLVLPPSGTNAPPTAEPFLNAKKDLHHTSHLRHY